MILQKPKSYWCYVKHGQSIADYQILRDITSRCKGAIKAAKSNYFSGLGESLNDPAITLKRYWSVLHRFLHKCKIPKISLIHHNNMFLTDTLVKANTFNSFSARQCSLIETGNRLPAEYLLSHHRLESVNLDPAKILSIIRAFDVNKVHGGTTCLWVWSKFVMNPWLNFFLYFPIFVRDRKLSELLEER